MTLAIAVGYVVVAWLARRFGAVVAGLGLAAVVAVVVIGQPLADTSVHPVRSPAILAEAARLERTMGVHPDLVIAANGASSKAENAETTGIGPDRPGGDRPDVRTVGLAVPDAGAAGRTSWATCSATTSSRAWCCSR